MRRRREKVAKRVAYEILLRDDVMGHPMYALLDELVDRYHPHLRGARIALAWCTSWKPDVDGVVTLGKCKKASDLDRELAAWDFVILLRRAFWNDLRVDDDQRRALLDHELCHAQVAYDKAGELKTDERGRQVYRLRKHDIEEFTAIVERYGCYKADLERFAAALRRSAPSFVPCEDCRDARPGWTTVEEDGVTRVARCRCWLAWAAQRAELSA